MANPGGKIKECAEALGKTPEWVGQLMRADFFRARFEERRAAFADQLDVAIKQRLSEVALASLDALLGRLSKTNAPSLKAGELRSSAEFALEALGYGAKPVANGGANPVVNVSLTVSRDGLERARESLRAVEARRVSHNLEPVFDRGTAIEYVAPEGSGE